MLPQPDWSSPEFIALIYLSRPPSPSHSFSIFLPSLPLFLSLPFYPPLSFSPTPPFLLPLPSPLHARRSLSSCVSYTAYAYRICITDPPVTGCDDSAHVTPSLKTGGALHSCRHRAAAMAARPLCRHARAPSCLPPVPLSSHRQTACERERGAPEAAEGQQRQPVNHSSPVAAAAATAACASLQLSAQPWSLMSE